MLERKLEWLTYSSLRKSSLRVERRILNSEEILNWAKSYGLVNAHTPKHLHSTICYSKRSILWPMPNPSPVEISPGSVGRSVKMLGNDKYSPIVLTYKSIFMHSSWERYIKAGASWDHTEYIPHITLCYDKIPKSELKKITPYSGPIKFDGELQFRIEIKSKT